MGIDDITSQIIDAAIQLHRRLGPGLMESVYQALLADLLRARSLSVLTQYPAPFRIDGREFKKGLRVLPRVSA